MGKTLTISVAAYNVEKYLDKLCQSLIDADCLEDLEVLIVNDGSKDRTAEIAEGYAARYPGVFFHVAKENGGHGSTINKGMELATGKYFKVLDGDDWVEPEGLKYVVKQMKSADAHLITTAWKRVYEYDRDDDFEYLKGLEPKRMYEIEEACSKMNRFYFHGTFFKTSILRENHIHIDEHRFYVDNEILWFPFPYVNSIIYYDTVVYCYRLGLADQSVNPEVVAKRIDQHEYVSRRVVDFYAQVRSTFTPAKGEYFDSVIADNISWHFEALLVLPYGKEALKMIKDYREYVMEKAPNAVERITAKAVKMLISNPTINYPIVKMKKNMNMKNAKKAAK